jgi:hypothetical protein
VSDHDIDTTVNDVPQKRCTGPCGQVLPLTKDYFYSYIDHGKYAWRGKCKTCYLEADRKRQRKKHDAKLNGHSRVTSLDKLAVIGTWEQCGSCGTTKGNIIGDVNDVTNEKYGYLCMRCYKLVRDFGGDPNRIRKALNYVEKTRLSRVAHKKMPDTPLS